MQKFFAQGVYNEKDTVKMEKVHDRLPQFNS
jgi:hypothetical protein